MEKKHYNKNYKNLKLKNAFSASMHAMFNKTDNILGYKMHPNKFQKIEIIEYVL